VRGPFTGFRVRKWAVGVATCRGRYAAELRWTRLQRTVCNDSNARTSEREYDGCGIAIWTFDLWPVSAFDDGRRRVDWHVPYAPSATN